MSAVMMKLGWWGIFAHMEVTVPYPGSSPFAAKVMTRSLPCFMEATISTLYFMMTVNNPTWRDYSIQI
jgi:hypothetical protein